MNGKHDLIEIYFYVVKACYFQLDLGSVDPFLSTFTVDIPMMTQITNYNGKRRVVRRVSINTAHPFARGYAIFSANYFVISIKLT